MPSTYNNLRVGAAPATPGIVRSGTPSAGEVTGRQLQDFGGAVRQAGSAATSIAGAMLDEVNQVRVNDAVNQARRAAQDLAYHPEVGYLSLKGDSALTRPSGEDIVTEYGGKLRGAFDNIASTLTNDAQRQQFRANAEALATSFHGQVEQHMLSEFRSHALSVQDGTIDLAADDAKRQWSHPDAIAPALGAARAAVVTKGRISGWSAAQTDAALLTTTSKVHTQVVLSALANNNPDYALQYLNGRRGEMTADDILRVTGHVHEQVWQGMAQSATQAAASRAMPSLAPTNFDRLLYITQQTESGGRRYGPDGKILEGPMTKFGTAKGEMQVLDSTAKAPGLGVKPAQNDTPDERARVGRDYLQVLLQRYGDPAKAWAAYHAGHGAVDAAIKEAERDAKTGAYRGDAGQPPDAWLMKLGPKTQVYVGKNMSALTGGAQPPRVTEAEFVNSALARLPPGAPPRAVELTRQQATQQFNLIDRSMKDTGQNAVAEAQRWLAQNDGDFRRLPPNMRDAVTRFAPDQVDNLVAYGKVFAPDKPEEVKTDLVLFNRLASSPDELRRMTNPQFESLRAYLSPTDFKRFAAERSSLLTGKPDESAENINTAALRDAMYPRLEALEIKTRPGPKDNAARERLGSITKFIRDSVFEAQRTSGKKMTPAEIEDHIDGLFAKSVEFRTSFLGFDTGTTTRNLVEMQFKDIPRSAAEGLKKALVDNGNKAPTEADILNLYRKLHAAQPK